jgi:replicative DNA helicase
MKEQNDGLISKALAEGVTKDYFVDPINKIIFDALCQCSSHYNQYLSSFCNSAKRNKLNDYLKGAVNRIESAQDPEIIHLVLSEINEMQVQFTKKKSRTMEDVGSDLRKEVTSLINGETPEMGLEWGIASMSKYAKDIEKDELVVIGAAPGRGKTSLAIQIFGHNVDNGKKGAYFSLEMSDKHILRNLIIQKTQTHPDSLKHAYEGDIEKWKNAISNYEVNDNVNIFSDCYNIDQIVARRNHWKT